MVVVLGLASAMLSASGHAGSVHERRAPMLVPRADHEALRAQVYAAFPRAEGRWGAVHVVDRECSVSRAVMAHLIDRRASSHLDELVVVIDPEGMTHREDVDLVHAGYRVRVVTSERKQDVVSVATPSMIVARSDGTLAYVGGHRRRDEADARFVNRATRSLDIAVASGTGVPSGFVDAVITSELVASGTTSIAVPVVGCVR
jgi:hypothetical protein